MTSLQIHVNTGLQPINQELMQRFSTSTVSLLQKNPIDKSGRRPIFRTNLIHTMATAFGITVGEITFDEKF